jgi:hypothetical protein
MKGFIKRLRGIVGTGLTWAVGWAAVNLGVCLIVGLPLVPFFSNPHLCPDVRVLGRWNVRDNTQHR